ncbi:MAG: D-sedoheptulose 7-phosphate isomerase, partial [Syntrophobacteraceae bacterium]|nr:D-sedoheptulose 7-phosphate isomerase [Syntrophobacteraceae bacterium]
MNRLETIVREAFREGIRLKEELLGKETKTILEMAEVVCRAFGEDHRLFLFGNGGSAADAQHIAAEFVNRFQKERPPLPAIALTVDTSILTSISNDYLFEDIFLRQLQALSRPGDVALGISTSGTSANVLKALEWARAQGLCTLGWTGASPSAMDLYCHRILHVPSTVTARIQECHIAVGHILCALVEET